MNIEQAINYLKSTDMSDEQIKAVMDAFICEDCISRQAVLDIVRFENKWLFDARSNNVDTDIAFNGIISKVSDLPPVQPKIKIGHWIKCDMLQEFKCSECRVCFRNKSNYCPHCGAKMEVNKE